MNKNLTVLRATRILGSRGLLTQNLKVKAGRCGLLKKDHGCTLVAHVEGDATATLAICDIVDAVLWAAGYKVGWAEEPSGARYTVWQNNDGRKVEAA